MIRTDQNDYDKIISSLIDEWINSSDKNEEVKWIKTALSSSIISYLYSEIRKNVFSESILQKKIFLLRFTNLYQIARYIYYYIPWCLKWILLLPNIYSSKKIFSTFIPDRLLSKKYLENLISYAEKNNLIIIHFGIWQDFDLIFDSKFFCFPYLLYRRWKVPENTINTLYSEFFQQLEQLCKKYFDEKVKFKFNFKDILHKYLHLKLKFSKIVLNTTSSTPAVFFIQDIDYLAERVLYTFSAKELNIPTIGLDHSILIYKHLYTKIYSDYILAWGNYSMNRIMESSAINPKNIFVTGCPAFSKRTPSSIKEKRFWVYILPSFQNPSSQTIYRSFDYSLTVINRIIEYIDSLNNGDKLIIKPHPWDTKNLFKNYKSYITGYSTEEISVRSRVFIVEDSTSSIEVLKYNLPVVYVADKKKNVHLEFGNYNDLNILYPDTQNMGEFFQNIFRNWNVKYKDDILDFYMGKDFDNTYFQNILQDISGYRL